MVSKVQILRFAHEEVAEAFQGIDLISSRLFC